MFMGPTWGPPGSCLPPMGPMLAPWTLLSGSLLKHCRYYSHALYKPFIDYLYKITIKFLMFQQRIWSRMLCLSLGQFLLWQILSMSSYLVGDIRHYRQGGYWSHHPISSIHMEEWDLLSALKQTSKSKSNISMIAIFWNSVLYNVMMQTLKSE